MPTITRHPLIVDPDQAIHTLPLVHGVRAMEDEEGWMTAIGHHHPRRAIAAFNALHRRNALRPWPTSHLYPRWGESMSGADPWRPSYPYIAETLEYRWWRLIDSCPDEGMPGHRGIDDDEEPCHHCVVLYDAVDWLAVDCDPDHPDAFAVTIWPA